MDIRRRERLRILTVIKKKKKSSSQSELRVDSAPYLKRQGWSWSILRERERESTTT